MPGQYTLSYIIHTQIVTFHHKSEIDRNAMTSYTYTHNIFFVMSAIATTSRCGWCDRCVTHNGHFVAIAERHLRQPNIDYMRIMRTHTRFDTMEWRRRPAGHPIQLRHTWQCMSFPVVAWLVIWLGRLNRILFGHRRYTGSDNDSLFHLLLNEIGQIDRVQMFKVIGGYLMRTANCELLFLCPATHTILADGSAFSFI